MWRADELEGELWRIFATYASIGDAENIELLSSAKFCKLVRECRLIGPRLTAADAELVFVRASGAGGGTTRGKLLLSFGQFLEALALLAQRRHGAPRVCVGRAV